MSARYAIYYTPASESLLYSRVSRLFGRSLRTKNFFTPEPPAGFAVDAWQRVVSEPAHYGLHATLKAPFTLAKGVCEDDVRAACRKLAAAHTPFFTRPLQLACLPSRNGKGHFLALTPEKGKTAEPTQALAEQKLAALEKDCVLGFEPLRAPLTEAEIAARGSLTEKEERYLRSFGYHLVFDLFRFHITLTNCLPEAELMQVREALLPLLGTYVGQPLRLDAISLCFQEERTAPFVELARFPLATRQRVSPYLVRAYGSADTMSVHVHV